VKKGWGHVCVPNVRASTSCLSKHEAMYHRKGKKKKLKKKIPKKVTQTSICYNSYK
jgi:hypothetical protein